MYMKNKDNFRKLRHKLFVWIYCSLEKEYCYKNTGGRRKESYFEHFHKKFLDIFLMS